LSVASTFVALESLKYSTPEIVATNSIRCSTPAKAAHTFRNCRGFDTGQRRGRGRGQNIFNIVIAAQADILEAKENGLCPIAPENYFIVTQETAAGHAFLPAEPETAGRDGAYRGAVASSAFKTAASSSV